MKAIWQTGEISSRVHEWISSDMGYYVPKCSTRSIPQVPLQELNESPQALKNQLVCEQCFPESEGLKHG